MGMDKYGCFKQMYVYYYWNNSQQSMKTRHVSKVIDVFLNNLFMSFGLMKKRNTRFPILLFLCTEQFTDTTLFTFLLDRAAHFWTCKMYIIMIIIIIITFVCLSVPTYCILMKPNSQQNCFHWYILLINYIIYYISVSFVRQRNEYEIVTETRPIKTT